MFGDSDSLPRPGRLQDHARNVPCADRKPFLLSNNSDYEGHMFPHSTCIVALRTLSEHVLKTNADDLEIKL
ncbi:hypothetical protein PENARI_c049G04090 [Penicillium arizonense]|uniref:Uncharacterized protein n=1 Tax=Penicillium arizonense TaxID=1835702 RepID=A0A1F5L297_PENAI|nr:hypothetical protein PENARI_c049G04090 [Penicillium arizonense]OGE47322.1 hypothetical protein PENARI_c049G04090 [Penicillium arizonense]